MIINRCKLLLALILLHMTVGCRHRSAGTALLDQQLASPLEGKHQVIYLEEGVVYWVVCPESHAKTKRILTREDCSHERDGAKYASMPYEDQYVPAIGEILNLAEFDDVKGQLAYFEHAFDEAAKDLVGAKVDDNDGRNIAIIDQQIAAIQDRIATLKQSLDKIAPNLVLKSLILGDPTSGAPGVLEATELDSCLQLSALSLTLVEPFVRAKKNRKKSP